MGIGSHTSPIKGATDTWLTPPSIISDLGSFDLDPCCPSNMPWKTAKNMITEDMDGLKLPWSGRVFMNPPYSKNLEFCRKFAQHKNGIALTFARTETAWFRELYDADAFLFLHGRLYFHSLDGARAKGNSGGPSVMIAYGSENVDALKRFREKNDGLLLAGKN